MNSVTIRGTEYSYGNKFSDLHLAPIAEFITTGIKSNESAWGYTAKMIKKILPDIGDDLIDVEEGDIFLSVKELSQVYQGALKEIQARGLGQYSDEELEDTKVAQLERQLKAAKENNG